MLSPATFGMAQTIIVKDSITHEAVPFVSVNFGKRKWGNCHSKRSSTDTVVSYLLRDKEHL